MSARRLTSSFLDSLRQMDERELTIAFQSGDEDAFPEIVERCERRVRGICRRMLKDPEEVRDAVQETFMRVYQGLGRFNGRYQLGPWVARIATNVCLDHLRSHCRHPAEAFSPDLIEAHLDLNESQDGPEAWHIRNVESRRVRRTLFQLSPMHRAAIVLRDLEGLSYREVAEVLDLSEVQVKALLHRARKAFKRSWASGVAALLPLRWLRVRSIDSPLRDQATKVASSLSDAVQSVAAPAASCSTALQQCTQFLNERAAAIVTVAVVGAASVGAVSATSHPSVPQPRSVVAADATSQIDATARKTDRDAERTTSGRAAAPAREKGGAPPSDDGSAAGAPEPEPTPAETAPPPSDSTGDSTDDSTDTKPATGGEDQQDESPASPPEESPSPEPTYPSGPLRPAIGFTSQDGAPPPQADAYSYDITARCDTGSIDETIKASASYGHRLYPAQMELQGSGDLHMTLSLWDGQQWFTYSGMATLTNKVVESARYQKLSFSGGYSSAQAGNLPTSGAFSIDLTLDCAASGVVVETVALDG